MAKTRSFLPLRPEHRTPTKYRWHDPVFAEQYPALFELLSLGLVDNEPRKTASISLFVLDERLKASIVDRDTQQALWVELDGSKPILDQLEAAASSPAAQWRPTKEAAGKTPF